MTARVWVDGRLESEAKATVRALDHGLTVGDGAFETMKIEAGRPFAMTRHLDRLDRSLLGLGLPPADRDLLREGVAAVLEDDGPIAFGRLRVTVTAGLGGLGSDRAKGAANTHVVTAAPQPRPPASGKVTVVPWTRNERSAVAGLKTTSYAENVVALARARRVGALEAVLANTRGELCECTGSNVFVVVDGTVLTPPADSGLLEGITRELGLLWWREDGMAVQEQALPVEVLQTADEVFITSSTKDVLPVHAVDDRLLQPGVVTARAAAVFSTRSAEDRDP